MIRSHGPFPANPSRDAARAWCHALHDRGRRASDHAMCLLLAAPLPLALLAFHATVPTLAATGGILGVAALLGGGLLVWRGIILRQRAFDLAADAASRVDHACVRCGFPLGDPRGRRCPECGSEIPDAVLP